MRHAAVLLAALALLDVWPAAAQRALTVYSPGVTVPVVQTYGWYARGRRAGGWYFQAAISNCQDYPNFISNAAEQCMRRKGYIYAPLRRVVRPAGSRVVLRVRG